MSSSTPISALSDGVIYAAGRLSGVVIVFSNYSDIQQVEQTVESLKKAGVVIIHTEGILYELPLQENGITKTTDSQTANAAARFVSQKLAEITL
jgi:tRNA A58 N-methylase Trm61